MGKGSGGGSGSKGGGSSSSGGSGSKGGSTGSSQAAADNRSNQMNPNNSAYYSSRAHGVPFLFLTQNPLIDSTSMDFLNKFAGGDSSSHQDKSKKSDSAYSKAMDAAEKYHAKEKASEFAQKRVAKREAEKHQPGYVEKKDKSTVDKAVEAAEDFLAKQGQPKPQHTEHKKDNQMDDLFGKAKGFLSKKH
ncbi:hypothetical protein C6341_g25927 [Phytophthora cactorum]|nr:hypothetical protein C6341_g25927 [Phytophthora cactorum]